VYVFSLSELVTECVWLPNHILLLSNCYGTHLVPLGLTLATDVQLVVLHYSTVGSIWIKCVC